jgi:hypothetical protein
MHTNNLSVRPGSVSSNMGIWGAYPGKRFVWHNLSLERLCFRKTRSREISSGEFARKDVESCGVDV